jgi:adenylate cyclase
MTGERGTILVVDDNRMNRLLLTRALEALGHAVATAEDGGQALELLREGRAPPFDVVLLDVVMPELDGYQTLARIKEDRALRHLPVIMISALDETESAIRCIALGAEDYLAKPFDPVLLRARLGACLEKKRLHDQELAYLAAIEARDAELAEWNRTLEARVQAQLEEMQRLSRLRRFLSPQLAEVIVSSGDERLLEGHRREVTVVFCDLRGFTAFAETVRPEELMGVLREYHEAFGPLIFRYEGTLERFAGDGMMVFFNDPVPCPDPVWRAVRMAAAMQRRMVDLARGWRERGHQLSLGVGIAVGAATCGRIGFEGRFDYAAIGPVTNLAARLCDRAQPGQILISERAYAEVAELVAADPVGELALKGFGRPVPAFNVVEVKGLDAAAAPVAGMAMGNAGGDGDLPRAIVEAQG